MNILTCTDSKFVIPTGVMFYSVCKNNVGEELNFYLIVDGSVTEKQKQSIENEIKKFEKTTIHFFKIDIKEIEKYLVVVAPHFPKSIYYRLLLADILPRDLDKILYLDGDIIVRHSLKDLWNTDISNYSLGAVVNQTNGKNFWERLKYPKEKGYFNSGVLLVNIKYWRNNHLTDRFIDYLKNNSDILVNPDQDVLNYVLQDSKLLLPERYNIQELFYCIDREIVNCEDTMEIEQSLSDPTILHYTGDKPWVYYCEHPLKNIYYLYKSETQWSKDKTLERKIGYEHTKFFVRSIKMIVKKIIRYNHFKPIKI